MTLLPLVAGRTDRPTALAWQRSMVRASAALVLLAVLAGIAALMYQTAVVTGASGDALRPAAIAGVLVDTHGGRVWLARHGLLVLLGALVVLAPRPTAGVDWLAVRGEAVLLAAVAMGLLAVAGHSAAVTDDAVGVVGADVLHALAAGVWVGMLAPLAALLARAGTEAGADARPYAVLATRRFSRIALACVIALVLSGVVNAAVQVGDVPSLVGTPYGRLLLLKIALLVPLGTLAVRNRRLIPRLAGDAATVGRPAMRDLRRFVGVEAILALALLAVVAVLSVTPPGRHASPTWPFSFRWSLEALAGVPGARSRALIGGQVMILGVVAAACAAVLRGRRLALGLGALGLLAFGAGLALPPLAVDAYPTTYQRPLVPYQAASIVDGASLFAAHCARCHGATGAGDGPERPALPRPPADLRAPHTTQHTAGDIFWWISAGIPAARMPAFAPALDAEQRWSLVNYVRLLGAAAAARGLGWAVSPPTLVAPDFTFAVGPTPPRTLREFRGRRMVLLVLYTLPASRERLTELARHYDPLVLRGAEVIAVPRDASPDAIRQLGDEPRIMFPVVTEGARDIVAVYDLLAPGPHAELLVDRQGYVRARWTGLGEPFQLFADVEQLSAEPTTLPPAAEHTH